MDIICCVLKNYYMINQEERNMKKIIKDCLKDSKDIMKGIIHHKVDLSKIYKEMEVAHFGNLIMFYCFLEIYKEEITGIIEREKKILLFN